MTNAAGTEGDLARRNEPDLATETAELPALAANRAGAYLVLATILLFPDEGRVDRLATLHGDGGDLRALRSLAHWAWWESIRAAAARVVAAPEAARAEYTELFLAGLHGGCMPTETAHATPEAAGAVHVQLLTEYSGVGLAASAGETSPDHAATELEFMGFCCGREAEAWSAGPAWEARRWLVRESRFLRAHLVAWLPRLARALRNTAPETAYCDVVAAAVGFCGHDLALLDALTALPLDRLGTDGSGDDS